MVARHSFLEFLYVEAKWRCVFLIEVLRIVKFLLHKSSRNFKKTENISN